MTANVQYVGNLRTQATHIKSNVEIITDAPTDNQGKGEAFSPTDLVCTALASCMLTIMGIIAERNNIDIKNTQANVTKIMRENPRQIDAIIIDFRFDISKNYTDKDKKMLENSAMQCPVLLSLHPSISKQILFNW